MSDIVERLNRAYEAVEEITSLRAENAELKEKYARLGEAYQRLYQARGRRSAKKEKEQS